MGDSGIAVGDEPSLKMARWCILEVPPDGALHLMGSCTFEGRMSTAIVGYDPCTLRARTASGREYQLVGWPSWDRDAEHTANEWLTRCGVTQRAHELRLSDAELAGFTFAAEVGTQSDREGYLPPRS